jgi:hypothetical protein
MFGRSPSVFVRQEFELSGDEDFDRLLLRMKFDDGFIAYLDGVEVARSGNTPRGAPPYDEVAGNRDDAVALKFETYDISHAVASLGPGTHVLAIHGLNESSNSSDMLILPELVGRRVTTSPGAGTIYYTLDGSDPVGLDGLPAATALAYSGPVPISTAVTVKARAIVGGETSALVEATFGVSLPLRVTEIMYHPPAQTPEELARGGGMPFDDDEYEYIELYNAGTIAVPLDGVRLAEGVEVTLDGELGAGQYGVIVKNVAAFRNRYGSGPRILAEYGDNWRLDNSGDTIALRDPAGALIAQVSYDDQSPWPTAADGSGHSLVAIDPAGGGASDPATWRASYDPLGTPASRDSMLGDLNGDDRVGLADLVLLRNNLGTAFATRETGDLNGDGAVTRADVAVLVKNLGRSAASPAAAISVDAQPDQSSSRKLRATRGFLVDRALSSAGHFDSDARSLVAHRATAVRR